jgi:hypothetical protein
MQASEDLIFEDEIPPNGDIWLRYFALYIQRIKATTSPAQLNSLKIECLEESGFEIVYNQGAAELEDPEESDGDPPPKYIVQPKGEELSKVDYSAFSDEEISSMVDDLYPDTVLNYQAWYIITYHSLEMEAFVSGMDMFREQMVEARRPLKIAKIEQESQREGKLRTKSDVWLKASKEVLDRLNLFKQQLFMGSKKLETVSLNRRRNSKSANFVRQIKEERE